jgi:hypothetical protein
LKPAVVVTVPSFQNDHAFVELGAFREHRRGGVEAGLLEAGQPGHRFEVGQLLHAEEHVLDWGSIGHR